MCSKMFKDGVKRFVQRLPKYMSFDLRALGQISHLMQLYRLLTDGDKEPYRQRIPMRQERGVVGVGEMYPQPYHILLY